MKKLRNKTPDFQEDYLLNTAPFAPERQWISVHSFCHSVLLPSYDLSHGPLPYFLVVLLLSGEYSYVNADQRRIKREPGFLTISDLNRGHPHFRGKSRLERYFVLIRTNRFLRDLLDRLFPAGLPDAMAPDPLRLKRCFEDIRRVLRKRGETDDALLGAMCFRLLCEASDQFSPHSELPEPLRRALQHIDTRIGDPTLNRANIARAAGISVASLGKIFSQKLHKTVNRHILDLRLEKSKYLLEQSEAPVSEVARQCGFAYSYYFIRLFREKYGRTALEYRKECRAGAGSETAPTR